MKHNYQFLTVLNLLSRAASAIPFSESKFIVTGGVVPLLYRHRLESDIVSPPIPVILTRDSDIVVPRQKGIVWPAPSIPDRLSGKGILKFEAPGYRGKQGAEYFQDESFGNTSLAPEYLEFLTWKKGEDETILTIQGGIRAQALRYLDLLTVEPVQFDLKTISQLNLSASTMILLPQPAMFILQKVLCRKSRKKDKQPKDLAYIYDVAVVTHWENEVARGVISRAKALSTEWRKWIERGLRELKILFETPASAGPHDVQEVLKGAMPAGSIPSTKAISTVVMDWIEQVSSPVRNGELK